MKRTLIVLFSLALAARLVAIGWPFDPQNAVHPLGNNWGEYQNYGSGGYFHNGIDVFPQNQGDPVHAVAHGWVKGWGTIQADYHWRLAISDSQPSVRTRCPGWLYAHIDPNRTHKNIGDEVNAGDIIGYAVAWPVTGFDHCHFARISDTGLTWSRFPDPTWWFTDNPLLIIQPTLDTVRPVIQDARSGQRFALCTNNTNSYKDNLNAITGDVDIVVRAYDKTGVTCGDATWDKLQPYKYVWSVRGSVDSVPATLGIIFSGLLPTSTDQSLTGVPFKQSSPCLSLGDYDSRDYYVIATNNGDGDSTIDSRDTSGCWHTGLMPNDAYWIKVTVSDVAGNSTTDSMLVRTVGGTGIAEAGDPKTWHNLDVPTIARSGIELAVSFDLPRAQRAKLQLYDPSGRLEYSSREQEFALGKHDLRFTARGTGVHLVVLTTGDNRIVSKLTVVQ
jgi:hypothetical protein